ncbi:MAG: hypothetical protein PHX05_00065 [Acidobacteriota bacterium]|nr:hypothetical protein [Acidobacteriota bacterium]
METATIRELLAERLWKVNEGQQNRGFGDNLIERYLDGVNREDLDALVLYLQTYTSAANATASTSVTNPMAGTQWARTGTWYGGRIWYEEVKNEAQLRGTLRIWQALWCGDKTIADVITEKGCRYRVEVTWYFGLRTLPTVPANSSGISYRMGPLNVDPERGTYTTFIEKRTRLYQVIAEHRSQESAAASDLTTKHHGVYEGDKTDTGAAVTLLDLEDVPAGEIRNLDRTKNEDCTQDIQTQKRTVKDQTRTSAETSAARKTERASHTENAAPLGAPEQEAGKIKRNDNQATESGKTRTVEEVVTVQDQTSTSREDSASKSAVKVLHTENAAAVADPAAAAGEIKRVELLPTEAGRMRSVEETITVKDQTRTSAETSAARKTTRALHTENAAALGTPEQEAGKIKRNENQPTESGKTRTVEEVVTVQDQTSTSRETSAAAQTERNLHTENAAPLGAPVQEAGKIKRNENQPTEAGRTRTVEEVVTVQDQSATSHEKSAARTGTTELHTQAAVAVTPGSPPAGKIYRARNTPTEAGRVRTENEVIQVNDQSATMGEDNAARRVERVLHTENPSTPTPPTAAVGEIKRLDLAPTESGRLRSVEETVTVKDQTATSTAEDASEQVTRVLHTENATTPSGTPAANTAKRVEAQPTESGKVRTVEEVTTPKTQQWNSSYLTRYGTVYYWHGRNCSAAQFAAVLAAAALSAATDNTVLERRNRFGLYDYDINKSPYRATSSGGTTIGTYGPYYVRHRQYKNDYTYWRDITLEKMIRMTTSRDKAEEYISDCRNNSTVAKTGSYYTATRYKIYSVGSWALTTAETTDM